MRIWLKTPFEYDSMFKKWILQDLFSNREICQQDSEKEKYVDLKTEKNPE